MLADYITLPQFKAYTFASGTVAQANPQQDAIMSVAITGASRAIERYCSRVFNTSTGSRVFEATCTSWIEVDDISVAAGVTVSHDTANDGTYETVWASTDYELRPLNGRLNGMPWPYTEIHAVGNQSFPVTYAGQRAHVQVSAPWGWPAVPDEVAQANYILALDLFKMKDNPFGVAGVAEFGVMRIRENPQLKMLLGEFRKNYVKI